MSTFQICIDRLLGNEGGYVNNPADPGGETQWGVSKRSYPKLDIKALTKVQACALYKRDFWDVAQLDDQPIAVANQMLDFAVNSGMVTALRALQRAIGVADDGIIGEHTLAAIKATEPHALVMRLLAQRLVFMTNCKNWPDAGKGWARRIAKELNYGADDA